MTTLASTLELAQKLATTPPAQVQLGDIAILARAILDLLGESQPCAMEPPLIVAFQGGTFGLLVDDRADPFTVDEARAYCALVLRTADEAEEMNR